MSLSVSKQSQKALNQLREEHDRLRTKVEQPIQFPEPSFRLDVASRASDLTRMFKHIHQSCLLHVCNFLVGNEVKLTYLIAGYTTMVEAENPFGVYSSARNLLELNAVLYEVSRRLIECKEGNESDWRSRGEKFFGLIMRARFATSDPEKAELLLNERVSKKHLKPFNIMNCIKNLAAEADFTDVWGQYASLCDFVHHNLSSQTTSNVGSVTSDVARSSGGGAIFMPTAGPVTQYQYPVQKKAGMAIDETAVCALRNTQGVIRRLNRLPRTPYSVSEIQDMTGTPLGVTYHGQISQAGLVQPSSSTTKRIGRNDPCPCGSGKKYKRCCGG